MFELRLRQVGLLKTVLKSITKLVTTANFDCSENGLSLQARDSSGVAMVALPLLSEGFEHYRCDRHISMEMELKNMAKILRCASDKDIVSIVLADDDGGHGDSAPIKFTFQSPTHDQDRKISEYEMKVKLMDIHGDQHLDDIAEKGYQATVRMPSSMFAQICKDLTSTEIDDNGNHIY